jgi:serine/threonine protein kinase
MIVMPCRLTLDTLTICTEGFLSCTLGCYYRSNKREGRMVESGTILLGKYRIERVLGKGGMGVVARAYHLQLEVPVAIKFLLPEVFERQEVVTRFLREAQAAVKLKSEHVSRIIDVGTLESGAPYIVMEFLEGTDLSDLLREQGALAPSFAVDLVLQACEALAEAHALGIVHRDIKPSNFFLTRGADGAPLLKVLDFGISKAPVTIDEGITHTQAIMGTPSYMSPEQMQSSKYVDARTDIWALGVVLYQLVSRRLPFRSESFAGLVMMVATQAMRALDDVTLPAGLEQVIARCLAKDPAQRFQSMAELAAALAPYAGTISQATRAVERTTRMLGMTPALERARARSRAEPAPPGAEDGMGRPISTIRGSMGEQVQTEASRSAYPVSHEGFAAPPETLLGPMGSGSASRNYRGTIWAAVATALLGVAIIVAILMPDSSATEIAPAKGGSTPAPTLSIDAAELALPAGAADAGVASGIEVTGAQDNGFTPRTAGAASDNGDGDKPAKAIEGHNGNNAARGSTADIHASGTTVPELSKQRASRRERRQPRKTATDTKADRDTKTKKQAEDPYGTRN